MPYDVDVWNLKDIINELKNEFPVLSVYLFGSRAYKTNSKRSDIDLLISFNANVDTFKLLDFQEKYPPLDIFINDNLIAESIVNRSRIILNNNFNNLPTQLNAVLLYNDGEFTNNLDYLVQQTKRGLNFDKSYVPANESLKTVYYKINNEPFTDLEKKYLSEAFSAYESHNNLSFIAMLGVFYEEILIKMVNAYKKRVVLNFSTQISTYDNCIIFARNSKTRLNNFIRFLKNNNEESWLNSHHITSIEILYSCFDVIRKYRNECDHPDPMALLIDNTLMGFQITNFITYISDINSLIDDCNALF